MTENDLLRSMNRWRTDPRVRHEVTSKGERLYGWLFLDGCNSHLIYHPRVMQDLKVCYDDAYQSLVDFIEENRGQVNGSTP